MTAGAGRSARHGWSGSWWIDGAVVALVHGVLWWLGSAGDSRILLGDEVTYRAKALAISAGEPVAVDLMWPPLYPEALAVLWQFTGPSLAAVQLAQLGFLFASAWLFGRIGARLGLGMGGQRALRLSIAAFPPLAAFAHYLWPEVLHLFFFSAALYCWIVLRRRTWVMALSGVLLGLALLTKSLLTLFVPVLIAAAWWSDEPEKRNRHVWAMIACLAFTVLPTLRNNHAATGRWVIADSSAFNLWVGLNDRSRRSLEDPVVWPLYVELRRQSMDWQEKNRWLWQRISQHVEEQGLLTTMRRQLGKQYFRLFDKDSYFTDMLPGGLLHAEGSGYRGDDSFVAGLFRSLSYLLYAGLLVATAVGLAWRRPRLVDLRGTDFEDTDFEDDRARETWLWVFVLFLLYNLALFFWLHVKTRYRVPMLPFCMLFAVLAVDGLISRLPISRPNRLAATVASAVLLFLAFGGDWLD